MAAKEDIKYSRATVIKSQDVVPRSHLRLTRLCSSKDMELMFEDLNTILKTSRKSEQSQMMKDRLAQCFENQHLTIKIKLHLLNLFILHSVSHTLSITHRLATTNKQLHHHTTTGTTPQHRRSNTAPGKLQPGNTTPTLRLPVTTQASTEVVVLSTPHYTPSRVSEGGKCG